MDTTIAEHPGSDPPVIVDSSVLSGVGKIATVVGPTTLLTALLFYFGWVWTDAESRYLGLDESLLGFSTSDYLLRSTSAAFLPLIVVLLVALLGHWLQGAVGRRLTTADDRSWRALRAVVAVTGATLLALAVITVLWRDDSGNNLFTPFAFASGTMLVGAAVRINAVGDERRTVRSIPTASVANATITILVIASCLFWEVSIYARDRGTRAGEALIAGLACRPDAALFSELPLPVDTPGVTRTAVSATIFRYDGLKLLLHASGKYFLVHANWSIDDGRTVVVNDSTASLVEFRRTC